MFWFLAELALFALLPFIQEPTATQLVPRETQPAQTLLEHFFDQHYNRHRDQGFSEVAEVFVSPRSGGKLNVVSSSNRNALLPSPPTSSTVMKPGATPARMIFTANPVHYPLNHGNGAEPRMSSRMNFATVSTPAPKPRASDDFVFAPSSRSNVGMTFAPSSSRPTACPQSCDDYQTCFNSQCYTLLKQGPCNRGEWLVEINGRGQCAKSNCQYPQLPFNGRCITETELTVKICSPDQNIALSRDGTYECDCTGRNISDPLTNRCYEAYTQGPCGRAQYFVLTLDQTSISGWKPRCVHNPCHSHTSHEQTVCHGPRCPHQGNCIRLGTTTCANEIGETGVWLVHDANKMISCEIQTPTRHIGNVPTFSCGKGSRRDRTGKCRKVGSVDFS